MTDIEFSATPTCAAFMKSQAQFRLICGPVGSGKTTACIFELLRRAMEQEPGKDGLRRTQFAIVRQTLQQLKTTVLKDIETWLGALGEWKVSESTFHLQFGDIRSSWFLLPLEDPEDQKRLLSMQLTGAWMSESIEMDVGLVGPLMGRCGRYPVPCTWSGVIADTNMPVDGSDWHKLMELEKPSNWQTFRQPGGLSSGAENLNWLYQTTETLKLPVDDPVRVARGRQYYLNLTAGTTDDYQRRYVNAEYGNDPSGSAVFKETFARSRHVVAELMPIPGQPLVISQDFGRNPCALICQVDHRGRLLVLKEVVSCGMGLEKHVDSFLRPALMCEPFLGMPFYVVGDPSGSAKSNVYEESCFDFLARVGMRGFGAPTNQIDKRLRAVEAYLLGMRGDSPALLIDGTRCPKLARAMDGMYRYKKLKSTGQDAPLPEKSHPWSDLADALQYACLVAHGGYSAHIINRITRPQRVAPPAFSSRAWT